jgi:hypothetical protein
MIMIMSTGLAYVYELRPPTDLLFISQVTYVQGEPWCNYIGRRKLLICPWALWKLYQPSRRNWSKGMLNLAERIIFVYTSKGSFNMPWNLTSYRRLYFPSDGRRAADFITLKNPSPLAWVESVNLGSSCYPLYHRKRQEGQTMEGPVLRWTLLSAERDKTDPRW